MTVFLDNFRPDVASHVVSDVGGSLFVDVSVKSGDYRLNRSRDMRATHFVMDAYDGQRWSLHRVVLPKNGL